MAFLYNPTNHHWVLVTAQRQTELLETGEERALVIYDSAVRHERTWKAAKLDLPKFMDVLSKEVRTLVVAPGGLKDDFDRSCGIGIGRVLGASQQTAQEVEEEGKEYASSTRLSLII